MYYDDWRDAAEWRSLGPHVTEGGIVIPRPMIPPIGSWIDQEPLSDEAILDGFAAALRL